MSWPKYVLLAWWTFSCLLVVGKIGKPQRPTTPAVAVGSLVIFAILATLVVLA